MYKKIWQNVALAVLIAEGIAVLWGTLAAWAISIYESRMTQQRTHESLVVDARGDAWINVISYGTGYHSGPAKMPYRTLDGEPVEQPEHDHWLSYCSLPTSAGESWMGVGNPANWNMRVTRLTYSNEFWFLVHNGELETGFAYLVGYDPLTKLPIGYCGLDGFRTELPPQERWFPLHGRFVGYGRGACAVTSHSTNPRITIASNAGWFEFDVRQREFRVVDNSRQYESVGMIQVPRPMSHKPRKQESETKAAKTVTSKIPEVFAARADNSVLIQHPDDEELFEFVIPEQYQDRQLGLYFLSEDSVVLEISGSQYHGSDSMLVWSNAAGQIQREEPIRWSSRWRTSSQEGATFATAAMPIPIAMGTMIGGIIPFSVAQNEYEGWREAGYGKRLMLLLGDCWLPLSVLVVVSTLLAWLTGRWHRRNALPYAATWATVVFLLGVPGFLAYLVYHRRPYFEKCPEPFPEPALLGTEIYA